MFIKSVQYILVGFVGLGAGLALFHTLALVSDNFWWLLLCSYSSGALGAWITFTLNGLFAFKARVNHRNSKKLFLFFTAGRLVAQGPLFLTLVEVLNFGPLLAQFVTLLFWSTVSFLLNICVLFKKQ